MYYISACHLLQSPYAVQDTRVAVAERALDLLAVMVEVGGGQFMSRRVSKEAWPVLARMLASGPTHKPDRSAPPGDDRMSPAVLQRVRHAVLTFLKRYTTDLVPRLKCYPPTTVTIIVIVTSSRYCYSYSASCCIVQSLSQRPVFVPGNDDAAVCR
jgi:hypothetical protein